MADRDNLPFLIRLLDDDSETVQYALFEQFAKFGSELGKELKSLDPAPTQEQFERIDDILTAYRSSWLKEQWPSWMKLESDEDKLEAALSLLAEFQNGIAYPRNLSQLLDRLAEDYRAVCIDNDPFHLARFLFHSKGLRGVQGEYDLPSNSNLVGAIEEKKGIPVTLACIYILVGSRLGLQIEGCNMPGHFLARVYVNAQMYLIDCFNGGRFLDEKEIERLRKNSKPPLDQTLVKKPSAEVIVMRVLNNLMRAYEATGENENRLLMSDLFKYMEKSIAVA